MRGRHLAGAEPFQLHGSFNFVNARIQFGNQIGGWNGDLQLAGKPFGAYFFDIHFFLIADTPPVRLVLTTYGAGGGT